MRIALTLESVSAVREVYRHESRTGSGSEKEPALVHTPVHKSQTKILAISKTAHRLFSTVVADAEAAPLREIALPEQSRPPLLQWSIPLLLFATIVAAKLLAKTIDVDWV